MTKNLDKPKRNLPELATELRSEVEAAELAWHDAVSHAIRAGELLTEAKAQVKHGEWLPWLEANFPGSPRSAQGYMRLGENAEDARRVAHLGIKGALKELAAPSEDAQPVADSAPETVEEVREMAASGALNVGLDRMDEVSHLITQAFDAAKPEQDYDDDHLAAAVYWIGRVELDNEKLETLYRLVVANASEFITEDPLEGPLWVADAATGIKFLKAQRDYEKPSDDDHGALFAAAQEAWMTHRAAMDALYRATGETPMDERPLHFNDAMFNPALADWFHPDEEEAA